MEVGKNIVEGDLSQENIFGESFVDLIRDVILPRRDEFILLMTCSGGTKYENFIHDLTEENQKEFLDALKYLKKKGYPVKVVAIFYFMVDKQTFVRYN